MRYAVVVFILVLYAVSFALPLRVVHTPVDPHVAQYLTLTAPQTFLGMFEGDYALAITTIFPESIWPRVLAAAWFANPLLWLALICLAWGKFRSAVWLGAAATILALLVLPAWFSWYGTSEVPHAAYWTWLACMPLTAVTGICLGKVSVRGVVTGLEAKSPKPHTAEDR